MRKLSSKPPEVSNPRYELFHLLMDACDRKNKSLEVLAEEFGVSQDCIYAHFGTTLAFEQMDRSLLYKLLSPYPDLMERYHALYPNEPLDKSNVTAEPRPRGEYLANWLARNAVTAEDAATSINNFIKTRQTDGLQGAKNVDAQRVQDWCADSKIDDLWALLIGSALKWTDPDKLAFMALPCLANKNKRAR